MTTHAIALRLINRGTDCPSSIAIFRHEAAAAPEAPPVAWQVVDGLAAGASHELRYDLPASDHPEAHLVPRIWIGVIETAQLGQVLDPAADHAISELSLAGIAAADIAMTGDARRAFALEDIKYPL